MTADLTQAFFLLGFMFAMAKMKFQTRWEGESSYHLEAREGLVRKSVKEKQTSLWSHQALEAVLLFWGDKYPAFQWVITSAAEFQVY